MKVLTVILLLWTTGQGIPLDSRSDQKTPVKQSNWKLVPDSNWNLHLININSEARDVKAFVADRDVVFRLSTKSETDRVVVLDNTNSIKQTSFNSKDPTRIIIHGWTGDGTSSVGVNIRKAYLQKGNFNVFIVDWGKGSHSGYITSRNRVEAVGQTIANFITFLNRETGMTLASVTIVGHSLGAHIAGFVGKKMGGNGRIGAIVGLDPANPLFPPENVKGRLDKSDATYVEVIHTDAGKLGYIEPIGHNDFYPNGGYNQPGCGNTRGATSSCSHARSYEYFAESISTTNGFWGQGCTKLTDILANNCKSTNVKAIMGGEPVPKNQRGMFLLKTNKVNPFSLGNI